MSTIAYMKNGIKPDPMPTYFDIQPTMVRGDDARVAKSIPKLPN